MTRLVGSSKGNGKTGNKIIGKHDVSRSIDASDKTSVTAALADSINALQSTPSLEESHDLAGKELSLPTPPPNFAFVPSSLDDQTGNMISHETTTSAEFTGPFRLPGATEGIRQSGNFGIEPNSPAYDALTANRNIHVSKFSKMSRRAQIPKVKKAVKKAAGIRGPKRGKPPRIPQHAADEGGFSGRELGMVAASVVSGHLNLNNLPKELTDLEEVSMESDVEERGNKQIVEENLKDIEKVSPGTLVVDSIDKSDENKDDNEGRQIETPKHLDKPSISLKIPSLLKREEACEQPESKLELTRATSADTRNSKERKSAKTELDHREDEKFSARVWKRDKKKKKKKDRNYVQGKVIDGKHELYALSLAVMLGLRTSISRTNGLLGLNNHRWLDTHDFMAVEKYTFPPRGDPKTGTPEHELAHTFKIKDYSPMTFAYIRKIFGVNEYDFLASVCGNANYIEFISNAKSGQFFFYSSDGKYMIKTMTNAESKFFRRILPHYFRHCAENPNTLITRFYGMYRVKMYHLRRNVKFVIMNSVFDTDKILQSYFDLKGSVKGRLAKPGEDVKKDNDVRNFLPEKAFRLEHETRERLRDQLKRDCDFFKKMKIMDYSMLIAIHHIPPKNKAQNVNSSLTSRRTNSARGSPFASIESLKRFDIDSDCSILSAFQMGSTTSMDEDDDCSYLDERTRRMSFTEDAGIEVPIELEKRKRETTKKRFWPFHSLYNVQGRRLISPHPDDDSSIRTEDDCIRPAFVSPISNRVDGGFLMDATGIDLPVEYTQRNGKVELHEGQIFYMGIIDVLQQFNVRKKVEDTFLRYTGSAKVVLQKFNILKKDDYPGPTANTYARASCVHPNIYADRFLEFFNEYTTSSKASTLKPYQEGEEQKESDDIDEDTENVEEVSFQNIEVKESSPNLFSD